jgi:hypothetical protein
MIWDKLFWLWFFVFSMLAIALLSEEPATLNILFGSLIIGLGLVKISSERSRGRVSVEKRILERLGR